MTGCRVSEAANIAVGEINTLKGQWRIPPDRAKNGHGITLPLHPLLGSVLGSGLQAPSKVELQVDRQLTGMEPWVWHDLRRSVRSGLSRLGVDKDIAERALNHLSHVSAMERVYNRHDYSSEIIDAVILWQSHVAAILCKSQKNSLAIVASRK